MFYKYFLHTNCFWFLKKLSPFPHDSSYLARREMTRINKGWPRLTRNYKTLTRFNQIQRDSTRFVNNLMMQNKWQDLTRFNEIWWYSLILDDISWDSTKMTRFEKIWQDLTVITMIKWVQILYPSLGFWWYCYWQSYWKSTCQLQEQNMYLDWLLKRFGGRKGLIQWILEKKLLNVFFIPNLILKYYP